MHCVTGDGVGILAGAVIGTMAKIPPLIEIVRESTELHVQAWGGLGEYAAAFKKCSHICVEGELRSREYESNGAKVHTYDIVASSIMNLRAGQRNAQAPDPAEAAA